MAEPETTPAPMDDTIEEVPGYKKPKDVALKDSVRGAPKRRRVAYLLTHSRRWRWTRTTRR